MATFQRIVAMVFLISLLGRALGFVRNLIVSSSFGTGVEASAYFAAVVIPMTLWVIFPTVINSLYIPTMKGITTRADETRAQELYSKVFTLTIVAGGGLSLLGWLLNGPIAHLLVPGFSAGGKQLVADQLAWMWPSVFFIGLLSLWSSLLNAHDRFFAASFSTLVNAVGTILCFLLLVPWLGVTGLAIGTTVGFVLAALTVLPSTLKLRYRYRLNWHWRGDPDLRSMGERLMPILFAMTLGQISVFFEKILGSGLGEDKISALGYAMTIVQLPMMAVGAATVPLFPLLSEYVKKQQMNEMKRVLALGIRYLIVLMIPMTVGLILLGRPLIQTLYENNRFGPEATELTFWALGFYALGLFAIAARDLYTRAFYALENTKTPVICATVNVIGFITLGYLLTPVLDHGGIALAMSVAAFVHLALLALFLKRRIGGLPLGELSGTLAKTMLAVTVMGLVVASGDEWIPFPYAWLKLAALGLLGVAVYGYALHLLKEPLAAQLTGKVLGRWKKTKEPA